MIDVKKIEDIAHLARIEIHHEEKESLMKDLSQVFSWVDHLSTLSGESYEAPSPQKAFREDVITEDNTQEEIVGQAPGGDGVFFIVPRTI